MVIVNCLLFSLQFLNISVDSIHTGTPTNIYIGTKLANISKWFWRKCLMICQDHFTLAYLGNAHNKKLWKNFVVHTIHNLMRWLNFSCTRLTTSYARPIISCACLRLNNILFSLSNLHELHLQTIRLGNKPMAYIKSLS